MDKLSIKNILDRYFEGGSSLEEEQQLKAYFSGEDIDPDLKEFQPLFTFFVQEQNEVIDKDLQLSMESKVVPLRRTVSWKWGIAAAVLISFASWFLINTPPEPKQVSQKIDWSKYEPEDNEQAIQLAFAAFKKTATAMQKGTQTATTEVKGVGQLVKIFK
jgi:hypothetical protein